MEDKVNMSEVISEVKNANEEELKKVIEQWFESTRTAGLKIGAQMISAVVFSTIQKHTKKSGKVSLNDYKRMTSEIIDIISVQLKQQITQQNDSEKENKNDRTTEENDNADS